MKGEKEKWWIPTEDNSLGYLQLKLHYSISRTGIWDQPAWKLWELPTLDYKLLPFFIEVRKFPGNIFLKSQTQLNKIIY